MFLQACIFPQAMPQTLRVNKSCVKDKKMDTRVHSSRLLFKCYVSCHVILGNRNAHTRDIRLFHLYLQYMN